jgi:hypothetical protein
LDQPRRGGYSQPTEPGLVEGAALFSREKGEAETVEAATRRGAMAVKASIVIVENMKEWCRGRGEGGVAA